MESPHSRHWSFAATDARYIYPVAVILLLGGLGLAFTHSNPTYFSRVGNFIVGIGVWISMRFTLREGIKKYKNLADQSPTVPGTTALNSAFFNNIAFSIGDAQLQLHGFALVIAGSVVGSVGDLILKWLFPALFP